jgi:hypothetical protein
MKEMKRRVPIFKFENFTNLETKPTIKKSLYTNIVEHIGDNIDTDNPSITVAHIQAPNSLYDLNVERTEFEHNLTNALEYFEGEEDYEMCAKVFSLIQKLK